MEQEFYKRSYSLKEFREIFFNAMGSLKAIRNGKKKQLLDKPLMERIMLAVTEVNGCELCSYYHTSVALKEGMSHEEISSMLSGSMDHVPERERAAVAFAQHYADKGGFPDKEAWQKLLDIYGKEKAYSILGMTRMIMMGNVFGIASGALWNRLKGKPIAKSRFGSEILIPISVIIFVPLSFIRNCFSNKTQDSMF